MRILYSCLTSIILFSNVNAVFAGNFYVGLTRGYGTTTWGEMIPNKPNELMALSTPIAVKEGGTTLGATAGYQFNDNFSIELSYLNYPKAKLTFSEDSLYAFDHDDATTLETRSDVRSFRAKISVKIPYISASAFSGVGIAYLHRHDSLIDRYKASPEFVVGLAYPMSTHIKVELGLDYVAGYGEAEIRPVNDFMPFVYSGNLTFSYYF